MLKLFGLIFPRLLTIALGLLLLSVVFDLISTYWALDRSSAHEANPLSAFFLHSSFATLALVKIGGVIVTIILALIALRTHHPFVIHSFTASVGICAGILLVASFSNLSVAFYGKDFFTTILSRV